MLMTLKDGRKAFIRKKNPDGTEWRGQIAGLSEVMEFSMLPENKPESTEKRYQIVAFSEVVEFSMAGGHWPWDVAEKALELYLAMCEKNNIKPYKDYSGRISLRISPHDHALAVALAAEEGISLNKYLAENLHVTF